MPSFTVRNAGLEKLGPVVELRIGVPAALEKVLNQTNQPIPPPVTVQAMIDTGATGTVIKDDIPGRLGLNQVGVVPINTPSSAGVMCGRYHTRLQFPNNVIAEVTPSPPLCKGSTSSA